MRKAQAPSWQRLARREGKDVVHGEGHTVPRLRPKSRLSLIRKAKPYQADPAARRTSYRVTDAADRRPLMALAARRYRPRLIRCPGLRSRDTASTLPPLPSYEATFGFTT